MTRVFALLAAAAVVVGLAIGGFIALRGGGDRFADCREGVVGAGAIGGAFALRDGAGGRVTEREVIVKPTLVYFGYTFCPDFCPTDLSRNALAAENLAERGIDVGQVFITIDPERDTPEVVRDYAAAIDPGLLGLSGTPEEIATAAAAYKVYYRKAGEDEYYMIDHSTFTYLMAPGVGFLGVYRSDESPEAVADSVACFAERL